MFRNFLKKYSSRYYHDYLDSFLSFLVPENKKVIKFEPEIKSGPKEQYDYAVISDVLSYVYDIQDYLIKTQSFIKENGRMVITQYNSLWEPILRLASKIGLRHTLRIEQNWLSMHDLRNFAHLADLDVVKSGTKMIMPVYIPLASSFLNRLIANIFPFSRLGIFHYIVVRKQKSLNFPILPSLSIIVPARNEVGTIEKIARELPNLGSFTEIIFIEGHSSDNTLAEIKKVASLYKNRKIKYTIQNGKGKGDAVRKGFDMANGDILTIYDADMTVPAEEIRGFYECLVNNSGDFINGSRLVYPMEKQSMKILNVLGNKFFSFAFGAILGQPLKDTLCGTKVLWRRDYEDIKNNRKFFGDFDPFGDFDLLFGAAKLNLKIVDMPVHYKERKYGKTNISRWKHGWLLLKMTIFAARKIRFI